MRHLCFKLDALFRFTSKKEGPNKGRQFLSCSRPKGKGCNFFEWADEVKAKKGNLECETVFLFHRLLTFEISIFFMTVCFILFLKSLNCFTVAYILSGFKIPKVFY